MTKAAVERVEVVGEVAWKAGVFALAPEMVRTSADPVGKNIRVKRNKKLCVELLYLLSPAGY